MLDFSQVNLDGNSRSAVRRPLSPSGRMCCLFSTTKLQRVGSGTTATRRTATIYWFVRQMGQDRYGVRSVDGRTLPWGKETIIAPDRLFANYTPEVALFEENMLPAIRRWGYRMPETDYGEIGVIRTKVRMDETNAYALLDLALDYMEAGHRQTGEDMINQLLGLETLFEGKDQHLFNRFGIALRKAGLHGAAITSYRRALDYTLTDDHLYYNIARAHYEQGQWWDCVRALGRCFEFNPELSVGCDLVELTIALSNRPELLDRYGKPPVPEGVAKRACLLAEAMEFSRPMNTPVLSLAPERQREKLSGPASASVKLPRIFQNRSAG